MRRGPYRINEREPVLAILITVFALLGGWIAVWWLARLGYLLWTGEPLYLG